MYLNKYHTLYDACISLRKVSYIVLEMLCYIGWMSSVAGFDIYDNVGC